MPKHLNCVESKKEEEMSILSAPNIWEPLYECAPQVVVTGYVPGATIDIYVIPQVRVHPFVLAVAFHFPPQVRFSG
jgi:hypothetical protein